MSDTYIDCNVVVYPIYSQSTVLDGFRSTIKSMGCPQKQFNVGLELTRLVCICELHFQR